MTTLNTQKIVGTEAKATKTNVKTAKLQNAKADALLEKVNAKAPAKSKAPSKPKTNIEDHKAIIKAVENSDFIKSELILVLDQNISIGKNAMIFKSFITEKKSASVTMLSNLGYDFSKMIDLKACNKTELNNRKFKLKRAIRKDYLYKVAGLFNSFAKEPTVKKLESIKKYDSDNSGIIRAILKDDIKQVIFSDEIQSFNELMILLPNFLNENFEEKITPELPPIKKPDQPDQPDQPLKLSAPMIATNNFNAIKDYILNDADTSTLELMQALIAQKLQSTEPTA